MKWTNEIPTKPGYYWAKGLLENEEPWMVLIFESGNELQATIFGDQDGWTLESYAEDIDYWMGPLDIPEPEK